MTSSLGRCCALLVAASACCAGCTSPPDYRWARETRNSRPYHGGAADVPDRSHPAEETASSRVDDATALGALAYVGVIVFAWFNPDKVGFYNERPPSTPGPPPER